MRRFAPLAALLLGLAGCDVSTHYYVVNRSDEALAAVLTLAPPEDYSRTRLELKGGPLAGSLARGAHEGYSPLASRSEGAKVLFTVAPKSTVFLGALRGGERLVFTELTLTGRTRRVTVTAAGHREHFKYRGGLFASVVNAVLDVR